tara:strand:- start:111 stop:278 length:168 start_codon:yes stop_codon:yes gene_type:complete
MPVQNIVAHGLSDDEVNHNLKQKANLDNSASKISATWLLINKNKVVQVSLLTVND